MALLMPWLAGPAPGAARLQPTNPYRAVTGAPRNRSAALAYPSGDPSRVTAPAHRSTAGAWESSGGGPALYSQGRWYELDLRPPAGLAGASVITTVYWSWSLSRTPPGLQVRLCRGTIRSCIDVSGRQSGGTRAFAGRGADELFILAYRVPGSSAIAPVYGGADHLIVNYRVSR